MHRRTVAMATLGVVSAGVVAAVTIPAGAASAPVSTSAVAFVSTPGAAHEPAPAGVSAAVVAPVPTASEQAFAALQRDLRLTPTQARARLVTDAAAAEIDLALRAELGPRFAGSWLDTDGKTLIVAVTDEAAAERVRAAGAVPKVVTRGAAELDRAKNLLDKASAQAPTAVSGWYVDEPANTVVVAARSTAAAATFVAASGLPAAAVRVVESTEAPRPVYNIRGGEAFYVTTGRCSIGLAVEGGFVTAGHCGTAGGTVDGFNQVTMGKFKGSSFPSNDYAYVETNSDWTPQPWVKGASGGTVLVAGGQETPVGGTVCRSGSTTGWHCGVVLQRDITVNYPQGTVSGVTQTDACAEPGDSGGAFISGDQAQGVTSGASGDCTIGGRTYFQPITEILSVYGLTLTTSGASSAPNAGPMQLHGDPATVDWQTGTEYPIGQIVMYDDVRYLNRSAHRAKAGWEPPNVPALWTRL